MTEIKQQDASWRGRTGYINALTLRDLLGDMHAFLYYTAGPPAMVDAMRTMLMDASVPNDQIHYEEFFGY